MTVLTGDGASNTLAGGIDADTISGAGGDDVLVGNGGNDTIDGGTENDILIGDYNSADLSSAGGADQLNGGAGNDFLSGGRGNDTLDGGDGDDVLFNGIAVRTSLAGGYSHFPQTDGGDDVLIGGIGTDRAFLLYGNRAAAITVTIANPAAVSAILSGGVAAGSITGVERLDFAGGAGNDVVTGGALTDWLLGGGGNDTLNGGGGDDQLDGGAGNDTFNGGDGFDLVDYSDSAHSGAISSGVTVDLRIQGVAQNTGGAGMDTLNGIEDLQGSAFDDVFQGNDVSGSNFMRDVRGGNDQFFGNGGTDYLSIYRTGGAATTGLLDGGAGNDSLRFDGATRYTDVITLNGGDDGDVIYSTGAGTASISGGAGNDQATIDTLGGSYTIALGTGSDRLILANTLGGFRAANAIVVSDFAAGSGGDILDLASWIAGGALTSYTMGTNPFDTGHLRFLQSGAHTLLQVDRDGGGDGYVTLLTLQNITAATISYANLSGPFPIVATGGAGADSLSGGTMGDTLSGLGGNDRLTGNGGNDTLDGGTENDILYGDYNSGDTATAGGNDTLNGGGGIDFLAGGRGNDSLNGGDGDDTLFGGIAYSAAPGSSPPYSYSYFSTDGGDDSFNGGAGNDFAVLAYQGRAVGITVDISNAAAVSTVFAGGVATGTITGVERLHFFGGSGADVVTGGGDVDTLNGGDGNDTLNGNGGDDTFAGGLGSDTLNGGDGSDTAWYWDASSGVTVNLGLQGAAQNTGGSGSDTLNGIENLRGSYYADVLTGNSAANQLLDFENGNDSLYGLGGNDYLQVSRFGANQASTVLLSGGADDDTLYFQGSGYLDTATLDGGAGNDTITARGLGTGIIQAGGGNDVVTLDTLGGSYSMNLGLGSDRLVLAGTSGGFRAANAIAVGDFATGAGGDVLDLTAWLQGGALTGFVQGNDPFFTGHLRLLQSGSHTLLQVDRDGGGNAFVTLMTLQSTTATSFVLENFAGLPAPINLAGGPGADVLTGAGAGDTLSGLGGNDRLTGNGGHDVLDGGSDADILYGDYNSGDATSPGGNDTLNGGDGSDFLAGGRGNDRLNGGNGDDRLSNGVSYNAQLFGTDQYGSTVMTGVDGGDDVIDGGAGIDFATLVFRRVGAVVLDNSNTALVNTIFVGGVAAGSITGVERLSYYGSAGVDNITAAGLDDSLQGAEGDDVLRGGDGEDQIEGGAGNDRIDGGAGAWDRASYNFSGGAVTVDLNLQGAAQNTGGAGIDTLTGIERLSVSEYAGYADTLIGDDGINLLTSDGAGSDSLFGNGGADVISAQHNFGAWNVMLDGGADADDLSFFSGSEEIGDFATLSGGEGNDTINAQGAGTMVIFGGTGNDQVWIETGKGSHVVELGSGSDVLSLVAYTGFRAANAITVSDFATGAGGDKLDLGPWLRSGVLLGFAQGSDPFASGHLRLLQSDANTLLQVDRDGGGNGYVTLLTLQNTTATSFVAGNFGGLPLNLTGGTGPDTLTGESSNDVLNGAGGNDTLSGGAGDDRLEGGAGRDMMAGGAGNDRFFVDDSGDSASEYIDDGIDLVTSSVGFELGDNIENLTLTGTAYLSGAGNALANTIIGNAGNNWLVGLAGNDVIDGGLGADRMEGGQNDDTYYVDHASDRVNEKADEGTDRVFSAINFELGANVENLILTGTGSTAGAGNALANLLTGNSGNNWLVGLAGNDVIDGGLGYDRMEGGANDDSYYVDHASDRVNEKANEGTDLVYSSISFELGANVENLTLTGVGSTAGAGNALANTILGNGGNNWLVGAAGNDVLNGGLGGDRMEGGQNDDIYYVDHGSDRANEKVGEGIDQVYASISFELGANVENLTLTGTADLSGAGNALANVLTGNDGANWLVGGAGDDRLDGGLGADRLDGGTGADHFWFATALGATNVDRMTDFVVADDTIHLDRTIFTGIAANGALAAGAFRTGTAAIDADDRVLYDAATGNIWYDADGLGGTAAILFARVTAGLALTNADFVGEP